MHKKLAKRICVLILIASLAVLWSSTAFAAGHTVDFSKNGTLTIALKDAETQKPIAEAGFALYFVGSLSDKGYNIHYDKAPGFAGFTEDINNINTPALAEALSAYLSSAEVDAYMFADTDETGHVAFADLPLGLYLVVHLQQKETHCSLEPFLVSIPMADPATGYWLYDVSASPKVSAEPSPTPTPTPSTPPSPSGKLPQTGMLLWPVPVLTCIGLLLFLFGWVLNKRESDET